MADAGSISISETLALFDDEFAAVSKGTAQGQYAFWLGSGISRDRVVGLDGVLAKLLEFLRINSTAAATCGYRLALEKIIDMAAPSGSLYILRVGKRTGAAMVHQGRPRYARREYPHPFGHLFLIFARICHFSLKKGPWNRCVRVET